MITGIYFVEVSPVKDKNKPMKLSLSEICPNVYKLNIDSDQLRQDLKNKAIKTVTVSEKNPNVFIDEKYYETDLIFGNIVEFIDSEIQPDRDQDNEELFTNYIVDLNVFMKHFVLERLITQADSKLENRIQGLLGYKCRPNIKSIDFK